MLDPATALGTVTLEVGDLDALLRFYTEGVGLDVLDAGPDSATLGRAGLPVLVLRSARGLGRAADGAAGLFHTAVVFDTRAALAGAVASVARRYPGAFTGSSDHLVSLAFYFDDPEGNGVELYWDRPRTAWRWRDDRVEMATEWLDPNAFLREHLSDDAGAGGARLGHVHLKVGDLDTARRFYVDRVGFAVTASYGTGALFVSAGGYHHHVGMNTWRNTGAGPRTPALGLGQVSVLLPDADDLGALRERLHDGGVDVRDDGAGLSFDDPWRNTVHAAVTGGAR